MLKKFELQRDIFFKMFAWKKIKNINPTHNVLIYVSVSDLFLTFVTNLTAWKTSEIEIMCTCMKG